MPKPEWIEPTFAYLRLATHWSLPYEIARGIVWNVMASGIASMRYRPLGSIVPQIVSQQIGPLMRPDSFFVAEFPELEIEWNDLLKHGRNIMPSGYEVSDSETPSKGGGRFPGDAVLVAEALGYVRDGYTKAEAARRVAGRAEGPTTTFESKRKRIERKLGDG